MVGQEEKDESNYENYDESDAHEDDDDDDGDETKRDDNIITISYIEPSFNKVEEAIRKVDALLKKQASALRCIMCGFEARNSNSLTNA